MEAFSLLKYWRGGGGGGGSGGATVLVPASADSDPASNAPRATTIVTAVSRDAVDTDDDEDEGGDDDGPFFDLEFAVPDEEEEEEDDEVVEEEKKKKEITAAAAEDGSSSSSDDDDDGDCTDDGEREFKFTLSSGSSNDRADQNLPLSPSDDLFFKGRLVPIEPVFNGSEPNSKTQFSLLKSATKFRVFLLGFKKFKMNPAEKPTDKPDPNVESTTSPPPKEGETKQSNNKFFTVKFKVEEVPIVSLFTRENSKSVKTTSSSSLSHKQGTPTEGSSTVSAEERRFSKEVMNKYLKKVKPLYIRVSKRYGEKLKFSGQLSLGSGQKPPTSAPPASAAAAQKAEGDGGEVPAGNVKVQKQGNIQAGLRVVCKHLGKSRSASSAATVAAAPPTGPVSSKRRDDSLLQQQDGIQSAILHCKRSFNASRESDSSMLSRSVSDPSHEKSMELSGRNSGEGKSAEKAGNLA